MQQSCSSTSWRYYRRPDHTRRSCRELVQSASAWKSVNDEAEPAEFRIARRMKLAVPVGIHITLTGLSLRTQRISCPRLSMSGSNPKYLTSESRQLNRGGKSSFLDSAPRTNLPICFLSHWGPVVRNSESRVGTGRARAVPVGGRTPTTGTLLGAVLGVLRHEDNLTVRASNRRQLAIGGRTYRAA